ncbi:hypothetical protein OWV82_002857 [Melia azedarach]|uniref:Uncharacterized protein n=1 Tax=Melia azedarach TaxID=155640 RepID=A0ACC1Z3V4_MELAZ|nr:hypothetical protein OWV82_002857 [Melia azedarach]
MALWFLILLPLFLDVGESQSTYQINQTDLQTAIADMRAKSYHGFVMLLKMLNSTPNSLQTTDVTFLMPNDEKLSQLTLSPDHLRDFILSHSIPTALVFGNLLHFPNGTLVPSTLPGRMLSITNTGKSGMFVNNARIVSSNVCVNSLMKCHGISSAITFNSSLHSLESTASPKTHG